MQRNIVLFGAERKATDYIGRQRFMESESRKPSPVKNKLRETVRTNLPHRNLFDTRTGTKKSAHFTFGRLADLFSSSTDEWVRKANSEARPKAYRLGSRWML